MEGDAQHVWRGYARIEDGAHMGLGVSGKHFAFVWAGSQPKKTDFLQNLREFTSQTSCKTMQPTPTAPFTVVGPAKC